MSNKGNYSLYSRHVYTLILIVTFFYLNKVFFITFVMEKNNKLKIR